MCICACVCVCVACFPLAPCTPVALCFNRPWTHAHTHPNSTCLCHSLLQSLSLSVRQCCLATEWGPVCFAISAGPFPYSSLAKLTFTLPASLLFLLLSLAAWRRVAAAVAGDQCVLQTTPWSQCSRSCGTGISTRVTNDNARCKLVKETRLCNVRPCSSMSAPAKVFISSFVQVKNLPQTTVYGQ